MLFTVFKDSFRLALGQMVLIFDFSSLASLNFCITA